MWETRAGGEGDGDAECVLHVRVDGQGCIVGSERRFGGKGLRSDPVDAVVLVIE